MQRVQRHKAIGDSVHNHVRPVVERDSPAGPVEAQRPIVARRKDPDRLVRVVQDTQARRCVGTAGGQGGLDVFG